MSKLWTGTIGLLVATATLIAIVSTADHDGDPIPDEQEGTVCSPPIGEAQVRRIIETAGGSCDDNDLNHTVLQQELPDPEDLNPDDPCGGPCPTNDTDEDGTPDGVELVLCGTGLAESQIRAILEILGLGSCDDDDFDADDDPDDNDNNIPDGPEQYLCGIEAVATAIGLTTVARCEDGYINITTGADPDQDGDNIPDALEAAICQNAADPVNDTGLATCEGDNLVLGDEVDPDEVIETVSGAACDNAGDQINESGVARCEDGQVVPNEELVEDLQEDDDGDGMPDFLEEAICANAAAVIETSGQGECDGDDLTLEPSVEPPVGPPGITDADEDRIPDDVEVTVCSSAQLPQGMCADSDGDGTNEDLKAERALDVPLVTILGPLCAPPVSGPQEICILQALTVGQIVTCSGSTDPLTIASQFIGDADCDGYTNSDELDQGCHPLTPASRPGPSCEGGGVSPPDAVACSGSTDPLTLASQFIGDADCDGYTNFDELRNGCNPFLAAERPGAACTLPAVPIP